MEFIKIFLILIYGMIRSLPFVITGYLILSTKNSPVGSNMLYGKLQKAVSVILGIGINAVFFLGMHYYHYKDVQILGYIKNVWGLNFYHHDVEYFVISATLGILLSVALGIVLRIFFCDWRLTWSLLRTQEYVVLAAGTIAFLLVISGLGARDYFNAQLRISEICSNNETVVVSGDTLIADYIELHNTGILPCQMDEVYLSDDPYNLQKMSLDGLVIPAGGLLVIPCVEDVNSFSISNKGEVIYLSNGEGRILEQIEVVALDNDMSYAQNGDAVWEVGVCTPGTLQKINHVDMPVLSHKSGFYDEEFALEIESASDTIVYYTLDGSIPDEGAPIYDGAIRVYDKSEEENVWNSVQNVVTNWEEYEPDKTPVPKAFLVRAMAMDSAGNKSDVVTATYFVGCEEFKNANIVSLIASPEDLFGSESGIYVTGAAYDEWYQNGGGDEEPTPNFKQKGKDWEREAVFEYFEGSESMMQQNVGIRIQGASTRGAEEKRFSVYARPEYDGSNILKLPLFEDGLQSHKVVVHTSFVDALNQGLMADRQIPVLRCNKVSFFLNGEFWYNGYLREKYDTQYFEDYYGIEEDNLILYKGGVLEEGAQTDQLLFDALYSYAQGKDFSQAVVYDELTGMMDVQNYIEFMCSNIYFANMDVDDTKNVVMWRSREVADEAYSDGKWRWALYDTDAVGWTSLNYYEVEEEAAVDSFSQQPRYADVPYNQEIIYSALRQNDGFCKQFVLTFMDLLNTNFSIERVSEELKAHGEDITWLNSFYEKRPAYMKKYLAKEFELSGSPENVVLYNEDESKGTIQINTVTPKMKNGSWSGEYYTDYPVTVTAHPADGYEFVGWSGSIVSTEQMIEVPVTDNGVELQAQFQKME